MSTPSGDVIAERAEALAALVAVRLPLEVNVSDRHGAWSLTGAGLLAHATGSLRSIVTLERRGAHNDGFRLLRSLYDHVVTFAWLAEDPPTRLMLWRLEDLDGRLKADREAASSGVPLLDEAERAQMKREVGGSTIRTPDLASKAASADRYWEPRLPYLQSSGLYSFRGLYTFLFRNSSGLVHATFRGLNRVTEDARATCKRVVLQAPLESRGPSGVATVVHGLGLYVASKVLGWPSADEVNAVFARFPST